MSTAVRRDGSDLLPGRGAPRNRPVHINQNNPSPPKQATPNYNRSPLQPLNASEQSPQSHPYYNQAKQQSEYLHRTLRQQEAELEAREEQQRALLELLRFRWSQTMEDGEGNGNVNLFSEDEAGESDVEGGGVRRRGGLEDEAEEAELDELEEDIAMAERVSELDGDTSRIEANQAELERTLAELQAKLEDKMRLLALQRQMEQQHFEAGVEWRSEAPEPGMEQEEQEEPAKSRRTEPSLASQSWEELHARFAQQRSERAATSAPTRDLETAARLRALHQEYAAQQEQEKEVEKEIKKMEEKEVAMQHKRSRSPQPYTEQQPLSPQPYTGRQSQQPKTQEQAQDVGPTPVDTSGRYEDGYDYGESDESEAEAEELGEEEGDEGWEGDEGDGDVDEEEARLQWYKHLQERARGVGSERTTRVPEQGPGEDFLGDLADRIYLQTQARPNLTPMEWREFLLGKTFAPTVAAKESSRAAPSGPWAYSDDLMYSDDEEEEEEAAGAADTSGEGPSDVREDVGKWWAERAAILAAEARRGDGGDIGVGGGERRDGSTEPNVQVYDIKEEDSDGEDDEEAGAGAEAGDEDGEDGLDESGESTQTESGPGEAEETETAKLIGTIKEKLAKLDEYESMGFADTDLRSEHNTLKLLLQQKLAALEQVKQQEELRRLLRRKLELLRERTTFMDSRQQQFQEFKENRKAFDRMRTGEERISSDEDDDIADLEREVEAELEAFSRARAEGPTTTARSSSGSYSINGEEKGGKTGSNLRESVYPSTSSAAGPEKTGGARFASDLYADVDEDDDDDDDDDDDISHSSDADVAPFAREWRSNGESDNTHDNSDDDTPATNAFRWRDELRAARAEREQQARDFDTRRRAAEQEAATFRSERAAPSSFSSSSSASSSTPFFSSSSSSSTPFFSSSSSPYAGPQSERADREADRSWSGRAEPKEEPKRASTGAPEGPLTTEILEGWSVKQLVAELRRCGCTSLMMAYGASKKELIAKVLEQYAVKTAEEGLEREKKAVEEEKETICKEVQDWARDRSLTSMLNQLLNVGIMDPTYLTARCTFERVSKIYKKALLKIHPDKFTQAGWREHTRQEERFKLINTAFEHEKKMASYRSSTSRFSFASSYDYAGWM